MWREEADQSDRESVGFVETCNRLLSWCRSSFRQHTHTRCAVNIQFDLHAHPSLALIPDRVWEEKVGIFNVAS